jgi:hypothetical protein
VTGTWPADMQATPAEDGKATVAPARLRAAAESLTHLADAVEARGDNVLASSVEYALCRFGILLPSLSREAQ